MLTGLRIIDCIGVGSIIIDPFEEANVNPNSVDLTLAREIREVTTEIEDPEKPSEWHSFDIPKEGFCLRPGRLYLASTIERTWCLDYIPCLHGKSSLARRGLAVHQTAGFGDHGFNGQWTLELVVVKPLIVRFGMRICQVSFTPVVGRAKPYVGRYQNQIGVTPSRGHVGMWTDQDF